MSKTILAEVDGFTPCIDSIVKEYGIVTAAVFGSIYRFCQMKDGVCWASQETIGESIGLSRQSVNEHAKKLVESGYLEIVNSEQGATIHYKDTGKANLSVRITGGVNEVDRGCKPTLQGGVNEVDTKIVFKDTNKETKEEDDFSVSDSLVGELGRVFSNKTGILLYRGEEWVKALQNMFHQKVTPQILSDVIDEMKRPAKGKQALTISGPWSCEKMAISRAAGGGGIDLGIRNR